MKFEPVAIVGRGCVLPGCSSPEELWRIVVERQSVITPPPWGRWGVTPEEELAESSPGGFVTGFESVFEPARYDLGGVDPSLLDPVVQWLLYAGHRAWDDAGSPRVNAERIAVIAGNLSFPSRALSDLSAEIWLHGRTQIHPLNRHNSGYPAQALARSLHARGPAFCLDAACASSLYALKLACDRLQDRSCDVALAAAVNATDNLILHQGFRALGALSPSGRSRPFAEGADGLLPAEGAAAVVLKRLCDITTGDVVHGVIRGIGLSNDGRRKGHLIPDRDGQREAMLRAYANAELDPGSDISLIECHATGTAIGDQVELEATAAIFASAGAIPVGSLKSNLGHLVTVAGLGSLLKLLSAMRHQTLPPTRMDGPPTSMFSGIDLYPQLQPQPWKADGPRRAALSNFGFGGNNAHLILEQHLPTTRLVAVPQELELEPIVICGVGLNAGPDRGIRQVLARLSKLPIKNGRTESVVADPLKMRMPPSELALTQGEQLAVFDTVEQALAGVVVPASERVGCFVGMRCSPESVRSPLRTRAPTLLGLPPSHPAVKKLRDSIPELLSGHVLGAMPNMLANRLTAGHDWRGQGFAVSAEHQSGVVALDLACRALRSHELDLALAAAADFSDNPVDRVTSEDPNSAGDGAAALVLKRRSDAVRDGDVILAELGPDWAASDTSKAAGAARLLGAQYGHAPAASSLMALALDATLTSLAWRATPHGLVPGATKADENVLPRGDLVRPTPHLLCYAADSIDLLLQNLRADVRGLAGSARLACVANSEAMARDLAQRASSSLSAGQKPRDEGVYYFDFPPGEVAFVYTGAAAAYRGLGRGLFAAFPELMCAESLVARGLDAKSAELMATPLDEPFEQLCAGTLLAQVQTVLLRELLGISPTVAMGVSSGETNALLAFGAWGQGGELIERLHSSGLYQRDLGGEFRIIREAWKLGDHERWVSWRLLAPVGEVRAILAELPHVELTIIFSETDCVIGGTVEACEKVVARIGSTRCIRVPHDLSVHCRAMEAYAETWRRLHSRPTTAPEGIRFYTNHGNRSYTPTRESVAAALTGQALAEVNFPRTVAQAYADGVRAFVEIGPRDTLTQAIGRNLADRDHIAVAANRFDRSDLEQLVHLCAALFAGNHRVNVEAVLNRLEEVRANPWPELRHSKTTLSFPAHADPPSRAVATRLSEMPLAPELPKVRYPRSEPPGSLPEQPRPAPVTSLTPSETGTANGTGKALRERIPSGLKAGRAALERSAYGPVSDLFGELFHQQDQYLRQVRLPRPPLLLADRITGLDAEAGKLGTGTIWTETDVGSHAWSLHAGFMRTGAVIEAGQCDLTLISYMGADFLNRSERVYRLLGCELTFHAGGLPVSGDTLRFQIEVTGHAELNGIRLFFFQYDCRVGERLLLSVRNGQAGFFSDAELAGSPGVLWDPAASRPPTENPRLAAIRPSTKRRFAAEDVEAFRAGNALRCFGAGFERAASHSRPPTTPSGRLALFEEVPEFDPAGGPWGRGYLKASCQVATDAWFYDGHFHHDPCMPGTVMAEAGIQALEFYVAAAGLTIDRDGYVFEPVSDSTMKVLCRAQVIPDRDHQITYEVFIDEVVVGDVVEVFASILACSDGLKVFYCPRLGVRLRRHWPLIGSAAGAPRIVSPERDVRGDPSALLECGSGAPSRAFGSMYAPFDVAGRVPRLPQPPYHMLTEILSVSGPPGLQQAGLSAVAEYSVPADAWYFDQSGNGAMPLALLTELMLQPCGWLASYAGFSLSGDTLFRNLDGEGCVQREVHAGAGPLRTTAHLKSCSRLGAITLVFFDVVTTLRDGTRVATLSTSFGFFTAEALASQSGLKTTEEERALVTRSRREFDQPTGAPELPHGRLEMIDEVDWFDATAGAAGLGVIRGRQQVQPEAWYFKAHFFSDPVQPGSLGLDALVQLLERAAKLKGLHRRFHQPRFQALANGCPLKWTYRGQVTPEKKLVQTVVEIRGVDETADATLITATGSLWVDCLRIYEFSEFSIRIVEDRATSTVKRETLGDAPSWVSDHCPTYTVPVIPVMALAGRALAVAAEARAKAAPGASAYPIRLKDFRLLRWASVPANGVTLECEATANGQVRLRIRDAAAESFELLGTAEVDFPSAPVVTAAERSDRGLPELPNPYLSGELFHGPSLQCIRRLWRDADGFEAELDLNFATSPEHPFDPVLLDGLVQCVPNDSPEQWFSWARGAALYPVVVRELLVTAPLPRVGTLFVRGRPLSTSNEGAALLVQIDAFANDTQVVSLLVEERLFPKGALAALPSLQRRAFLTAAAAEPHAVFSDHEELSSYLEPNQVLACDWLPGTMACAYGAGTLTGAQLVRTIAVKEHFAQLWKCHPSQVLVEDVFASSPNQARVRYVQTFDRERRAWRTHAATLAALTKP